VEEGPHGRSTFVDDGVRVTHAETGSVVVSELVFPAAYRMRLDPERGYVVVVLDGGLVKTFARSELELAPGSVVTMPAGALHASAFGRSETRVVALHPPAAADPIWPRLLRRLRHVRDGSSAGLAWRVVSELSASDDAWPLAVEGFGLELLATLARQSSDVPRKPPVWLREVHERLHSCVGVRPSLGELAAGAGVHPSYLAQVFRQHYGTSVGEYLRRLRLDWAAAQLASTDVSLAAIAMTAGFADQAHFTRAFKRHIGVTPGRYRVCVRS
jgi:AraC family transcriptional regulator